MEFRFLGPLEVFVEDRRLELGGSKQRQLLAILLLHANEVVSADKLIEGLWGANPPATAAKGLQVHLSRLRKALGRDDLLLTRSGGYTLIAAVEELDASRFELLAARGRERLAAGDIEGGSADLHESLRMWRGAPLADFTYESFAQAEIARLEELRLVALEDRIEADLAAGRDAELVGELEGLVAAHPLRERLRSQLMIALYRAGRQAEALAQYQDARRVLVEGLGIEPSAALKTLERQILAQDTTLDAPLGAGSPRERDEPLKPQHNLPAAVTPLIGRQRDVVACCDLLRAEPLRLLTLTGAGGIGKTRLALQIAAELVGEFRDGVFLVPFARLTDSELVAATIARALELAEAEEAVEVRLKRFVQGRELLLVIDNFEQLLPAAPLLGELLEAAPGLKLLATSRALLRLSAEHQYPVSPLELPDPKRLPDVASLGDLPAVALFVERAQALKPGFELTEGNARAVAEICLRVDGLPLALELAAARVRLLAPQALLARLEKRLPLLTGGAREAPARQQTLRATIDWSYDLLSASEQVLFVHLACFAGGCTLEAADVVCGAALDELASLVDKSLLREREGLEGEPRFDMLGTVREYALERLEAGGEANELRRRHAEHCVLLAERAEPEILRADQAEWLQRLEADHDNFRVALEWSLGAGEVDLALRLIGSLRRAWVARGYLTETRRWLEAALAQTASSSPPIRAKAVYGLGRVALAQGDYDQALPHLQESTALSRQIGDSEGLVFALADLGWIASAQGDHEHAALLAQEGLAEARNAENEMAAAAALHSLGCVMLHSGDYARARNLLEESLTLRRQRLDKRNTANSLASLGATAFLEGDHARARELLDESLSLGRELGNLLLVAAALANLALVALFEADCDEAASLATEALQLSREAGNKWTIGECLHILAGVAAAQGQATRAATLAGAADAIHESIQAPPSRAERAIRDRFLTASQKETGEAAFALARTQGHTMGTDGAVEYALAESLGTARA
jgi:predicted ATPase/DNA-binding SARP family transcriptional activator